MTANSLTVVLLRLLGIYLLANSVVQARDLAFLVVGPQHAEPDANLRTYFTVASLAPACWYLLAGLLLVFVARRIASLIVPGDPNAIVATTIAAEQLGGLLFTAAGVIVAAMAVPCHSAR